MLHVLKEAKKDGKKTYWEIYDAVNEAYRRFYGEPKVSNHTWDKKLAEMVEDVKMWQTCGKNRKDQLDKVQKENYRLSRYALFSIVDLLLVVDNVLSCLLQVLSIFGELLHLHCVIIAFVGFELVRHLLFSKIRLNDKSFESCLLRVLLTELSLHVFEERVRADLNVGDFDGSQVNTPSFDDLRHLCEYSLAKALSVFEDFVDGGVGDLVPHDGTCHRTQTQFREQNTKKATLERLVVETDLREEQMSHQLEAHKRYYDTMKVQ
jgi:hypothetical protein